MRRKELFSEFESGSPDGSAMNSTNGKAIPSRSGTPLAPRLLERSIMSQTGHRSVQMVRRYIRDGSLFRENSVGKLGL